MKKVFKILFLIVAVITLCAFVFFEFASSFERAWFEMWTEKPLTNAVTEVVPKSAPEFSGKNIFLTFDADMTPYMKKEQETGKVKQWYDPELISYLEKNNIPSTFFLTGMFTEMYPDLVKKLAANSNFSIQNHSYSHLAFDEDCYGLAADNSDKERREEIEKAQSAIKLVSGKAPTYFRYPGLCHNAHDDAIVAEEGLSIIKDEFSSGDAYMKKAIDVFYNVLKNINKIHVIVFHMGTKNTPATTAAIKLLVPKLQKLGYVFKAL